MEIFLTNEDRVSKRQNKMIEHEEEDKSAQERWYWKSNRRKDMKIQVSLDSSRKGTWKTINKEPLSSFYSLTHLASSSPIFAWFVTSARERDRSALGFGASSRR